MSHDLLGEDIKASAKMVRAEGHLQYEACGTFLHVRCLGCECRQVNVGVPAERCPASSGGIRGEVENAHIIEH